MGFFGNDGVFLGFFNRLHIGESYLSKKEYGSYLEDQSHKKLDLCGICGQPRKKVCFECCLSQTMALADLEMKIETLVVRFNELCRMLSVQLANSSFDILAIKELTE